MKSILKILSAAIMLALVAKNTNAQECVTCGNNNDVAIGQSASTSAYNAVAIGQNTVSNAPNSITIGSIAQSTSTRSITIGSGRFNSSGGNPLVNNRTSIALGIGSNLPTLRVEAAAGLNRTGRVTIGNIANVNDIKAKLHILSDNQEDAGIFLQTSNSDASSFIKLTDNQHCISVKEGKLSIVSNNNELNYYGTNAELSGNQFSLGYSKNRKLTMYANENPAIFSNAYRSGGTFYRNTEGSSYAIEFNNDALRIRTAVNQIPRGTEITNWKDALFLTTNGKVGIGSTETFLMNKNDEEFILFSPKRTVMESDEININAQNNITLHGKVGINAINNTSEYALAVDGGIITTEVFIQEVDVWHDGVFKDNYKLMPLADLQKFIKTNLHLPEVPTEAEVLKQGYDLAEMQGILLKKIEELTLYTIKQQELIEQLQQKVNELEAR